MRVLLATDGTWGDVGPQLAVAHELRARGNEVLALLNPSFAADAERLGIRTQRVGVSWQERLIDADPAHLARPMIGTIRVLRDHLIPDIPSWIVATQRANERFRPHAALVHHVCWGPLWSLYREGVPMAATFLAPVVLLSADDPGRPLSALPPAPSFVARANRVALKSLFRRVLDRPARARFEAAGLPAPRDLFFLAQRVARVSLALWSERLRGAARDDPANLHICGYSFPVEPDPLALGLSAFLDAGDAPVVVTFGTSMRETGLEVYRAAAEASARIGRRAVLLTGAGNAPEPLPVGVAAFEAAPHGRLLPRACAVVHHAGAGTGAQVLRAGKPAVIVPFGHDQADNAHRAEQLGVARVVPRWRASADRLARALEAVLADPVVRESARQTGEIVRREGGTHKAARLVETIAEEPTGAAAHSAE